MVEVCWRLMPMAGPWLFSTGLPISADSGSAHALKPSTKHGVLVPLPPPMDAGVASAVQMRKWMGRRGRRDESDVPICPPALSNIGRATGPIAQHPMGPIARPTLGERRTAARIHTGPNS